MEKDTLSAKSISERQATSHIEQRALEIKEIRDELNYSLSELNTSEGEVLREMLKELSDAEVDSEVFPMMRFAVSHAKFLKSEKIIAANEKVRDGIRSLVIMGQWTNICQIMRSLPKELIQAVASSPRESELSIKINTTFATQVEDFMDLGSEDRQLALDLLKAHKESEANK